MTKEEERAVEILNEDGFVSVNFSTAGFPHVVLDVSIDMYADAEAVIVLMSGLMKRMKGEYK